MIDSLEAFLDTAFLNPNVVLDQVRFSGFASPEGPERLNQNLAAERRGTWEAFVTSQPSYPEIISTFVNADVIDWPYLNRLSADIFPEGSQYFFTVGQLQRAYNGELWRRLAPLFPDMRYAEVAFRYHVIEEEPAPVYEPIIEKEEEHDAIADLIGSDQEFQPTEPVAKSCRPLYMSLKTNMLYDAAAIPNVGVEFALGRHFSIMANWGYSWWSSNASHHFWRYYGGDAGLRYWFPSKRFNKPLTGHHLGLYGQMFTYDFELGGKGQQSNFWNYGGGLEYGFALPIGRRLNIDFTIGLGYITGEYYKYRPFDGHYVWESTNRRHWFGPTKAEISLVWLIGCDNYNRKKGSAR